jgi:hypothetical protein
MLNIDDYPAANQIGGYLIDALKDLFVLKGVIKEENGLLIALDESDPDVASALCTLRDAVNY